MGFAQSSPSTSQWISTGTVDARIESSGPLLSEYRIPGPTPDATVTAFKNTYLWIGGIDPAGNQGIAIQRYDTSISSFKGGFRGIQNSAGVWKVTKTQVEQHRQDFADNGIINNPIPAIFSWPGRGNPFSIQYNGFSVDSVESTGAPFKDFLSIDHIYDPSKGDFPDKGIYSIEPRFPDEIVFSPFFERQLFTPAQYAFKPIYLNCNAVYFSYYCDDVDYLDNAIFGSILIQLTGTERYDSLVLGFVLDGNAGGNGDDYFGTQTDSRQVYFYNADDNDILFGDHPPLIGFELVRGLLDSTGFYQLNSVMPYHFTNSPVPNQMKPPQAPAEYYNYLTGTWRDGTPLTEGGNGFNISIPNPVPISIIFPGNPGNANEWSEQSAGNPPGDRRAILTTGPVALKPGNSNQAVFAMEFIPGGTDITQQLATLDTFRYEHGGFFYGDFYFEPFDPYDTLLCFQTSRISETGRVQNIKISPNPTQNSFTLIIENQDIKSLSVFNTLGQQMNVFTERTFSGMSVKTENFPPGLYWLSGICKNGRPFQGKLIITR